jgi:hypothetical protein
VCGSCGKKARNHVIVIAEHGNRCSARLMSEMERIDRKQCVDCLLSLRLERLRQRCRTSDLRASAISEPRRSEVLEAAGAG